MTVVLLLSSWSPFLGLNTEGARFVIITMSDPVAPSSGRKFRMSAHRGQGTKFMQFSPLMMRRVRDKSASDAEGHRGASVMNETAIAAKLVERKMAAFKKQGIESEHVEEEGKMTTAAKLRQLSHFGGLGKKKTMISLRDVRQVKGFNLVVGAATNKRFLEMDQKEKADVSVTLNAATLSILKSLKALPVETDTNVASGARPPTKERTKKKRPIRKVLTRDDHNAIAQSLAYQYTRDIHTLNTFNAVCEDKKAAELLMLEQEAAITRRVRQTLIDRQHRQSRVMGSGGSSHGGSFRGAMRDVLKELDDEDSSDSSEESGRFSPVQGIGGRRTSSILSTGSAGGRRTSSILSATTGMRRPTRSNLASNFAGAPLSPRRSSRMLRRSISRSKSPGAGTSSESDSPASPRRSGTRSVLSTSPGPNSRRLSTSPFASPSQDDGHRRSTMIVGGKVQILTVGPKKHHEKGGRRSLRKSDMSKKRHKQKEVQEVVVKAPKSVSDLDRSDSDLSLFSEIVEEEEEEEGGGREGAIQGDRAMAGKAPETNCVGGGDGTVKGDEPNVDNQSESETDTDSDSSSSSMMLDIDVVQSRLLQKQNLKAAAAEEKRLKKEHETRKRKADPTMCSRASIVNLANAQLGDKWVETFASLMTKDVKTIDLSGNRISKLATHALFTSLTDSLRNLKLRGIDLSHSADVVSSYLLSPRCHLLRLDLSETKLGNPNCVKLCRAMAQTASVTDLNLSNNMISAAGCEAMAKMFEDKHLRMMHLSMAWNKIDGASSTLLFKALSSHQRKLMSLDVSWNSIGTFPTPHTASIEGVNALTHFIKNTSSLFHVNLSANKFSYEDSVKLSKVLQQNESICGIHFDKNPHGKIDSKGFLVPIDETAGAGTGSHNDISAYQGSNCWCCGQWVEVEFEFNQGYVDEDDPEIVYLRLSIDDWRKDKMKYVGDGRFVLNRMVPRVCVTYCFSVGKGSWRTDLYSMDQKKCFDSTAPTSTVNVISLEDVEIFAADVDWESHYDPAIHGGTRESVIWPFYYQVMPMHLVHNNCAPRGTLWAGEEVTDELWCLETSKVFGARKKENGVGTFWDTEELFQRVFDCDWLALRVKLLRMKIDEVDVDQVGQEIGAHYRRLCNLFKNCCVLGRNSSWVVNMICFEQFLSSCGISDGEIVKKRDIDRIFISTTAEKNIGGVGGVGGNMRSSLVQQSGLDRVEFIEALVRIARLKFLENGHCDTVAEAFNILFHDHIRHARYVDPDEFRKAHFYVSETEDVLGIHVHNLRVIFGQYCSISSSIFGRLMNIEEFHTFLDDTKLCEKKLLTHDQAASCFVNSKFISIDERKSSYHKTLTFIDFLEAIARICMVCEDNKLAERKSIFDLGFIVKEAQRRNKSRGHIFDDKLKTIVIGLRESRLDFRRNLKLVFSDNDYALKKAANILQRYVRGFKDRVKARNKRLDSWAGWDSDDGGE